MNNTTIIVLLITSIFGGVGTYVLTQKGKVSSVIASTILSLLVALFFIIFNDLEIGTLSTKIPVIFIGASFVGMSSPKILENISQVAFSSLVFGVVFLSASTLFKGFGGGLGTSAAIGVICNLGLQKLLAKK